MDVQATTDAPLDTGADTIVVGLFAGEAVAHDVGDGVLQGLVDEGEARAAFKKLAVAHAEGRRFVLVGLGDRDAFTPERARVAAAVAHGRARELGARVLCWEAPHKISDLETGALVEGTVLHAYRFDRYLSAGADDEKTGLERLVISAHDDVSAAVARAAVVAAAQNAARDLQNTPANDLTPTALAERARELANAHDSLSLEVLGRDELDARGMGAFAAVAQGSYQEPQLIALRYEGGGEGPLLGFVGKAVTFDTGGISIKPAAKMHEMKFDMSGGAAVLSAMGAIAELALPVRVLAVIGATENMPSGRSMRPGDIVRATNGVSIEINNTDAEGRLVLADCLCYAVEHGAERLVDMATLTGGVVVALGSTFAGLMANDDDWAGAVEDSARRSGEDVWRLPLHPEYDELIKGRYADIVNAPEARKAQSITAAEFLKRFVGDTPWAHVDIAGTAYDAGRAYAPKGGNGFGVRLLVDLAAASADAE